jgi:hypothetical protein
MTGSFRDLFRLHPLGITSTGITLTRLAHFHLHDRFDFLMGDRRHIVLLLLLFLMLGCGASSVFIFRLFLVMIGSQILCSSGNAAGVLRDLDLRADFVLLVLNFGGLNIDLLQFLTDILCLLFSFVAVAGGDFCNLLLLEEL